MPDELQCLCGKRLVVSADALGGQGRCPSCGRLLDLPAPELAAPPADLSAAVTDAPSGPPAERPIMTEIAADPETAEVLAGARTSFPGPSRRPTG